MGRENHSYRHPIWSLQSGKRKLTARVLYAVKCQVNVHRELARRCRFK
jgi:hypothetical protein